MAFQKISGLLSPTTDAYQAKLNKLFGNGLDGNIIYASGVNFLTRDYYFTNLTVNSGATLFTNGFKIFVKETLTNNGTIGMPSGTSQTTSVLGGTVLTRNDGNISYNSANAIGGSITASQITNFDELISGSRLVGGELQKIYAGAVGASGASGAAGNAGSANPGGAGTAPATPGNPGTAGTAGTGGTGGAGGQGGGMVVVLAKIVTGSGTFVSEGTVGTAGNPGNPGNAGTSGNTGSTSPGTSHPGNPFSHINPHTEVPTHTAASPFHQANPDGASHIAAATNPAYGIAHNIATPYHFHAPGNPFHNPGSHGTATHSGAHVGAHHTSAAKGRPAAHRGAHHTPGNPYSHHHPGNPGHNAARQQPAHHLGNQHTHPTFHHIHTAASHNTHPTPHTQGHNAAVNGHTHQANPNTTGINPAGHNATVPGGAAGTGNPGNPGAAGETGATGQVGAVIVLGQEVTASVSTSTVIADID
jgi:hypothetical protein